MVRKGGFVMVRYGSGVKKWGLRRCELLPWGVRGLYPWGYGACTLGGKGLVPPGA